MPERKTLNEDLFYRGSSANLPRLHTCENKVPFRDFSQFAVTMYIQVSFLTELELICLLTSIAIASTQLNDFNYFSLTLILFNVNQLFADSEVVTSTTI